MKKFLAAMLSLMFFLSGCSGRTYYQRFSRTFYDAFDTVVVLTCYAENEAFFEETAALFETELLRMDRVFDRYEKHEGITGLWELNHAGGDWVAVEPELFSLLEDCAHYHEMVCGGVNIAMGNVLEIWHDCRTEGVSVPSQEVLREAAQHADPAAIQLDPETGKVRLRDPDMTLDLGAVAKGWAVERLAEILEERCPDFLIDAGGNVRAGLREHDRKNFWTIGVTNPADLSELLMTLQMCGRSAVTSGGYQRWYEVDGVRYHHIIDPATLMPAEHFAQVTVLAEDSGLADYLSTALFVLPYSEGVEVIDRLDGVDAVWAMHDGTVQMTDGVRRLVVDEK